MSVQEQINVIDYADPGVRQARLPSQRRMHAVLVIVATLTSGVITRFLAFSVPGAWPELIMIFIRWWWVSTITVPLALSIGLAVRRSGRGFRACLCMLCLVSAIIAPIWFARDMAIEQAGMPISFFKTLVEQNVPASVKDVYFLPPERTAEWVLHFKIASNDMDSIIAKHTYARLPRGPTTVPADPFIDACDLQIGEADEFYTLSDGGTPPNWELLTLRVNKTHTEALLRWQNFKLVGGRVLDFNRKDLYINQNGSH